jgi:RNA polymerase sigma-70 factor (ECF subfamily)
MIPVFTQGTHALLSLRLIEADVVERTSTSNFAPADAESLTRGLAAGEESAFSEFHSRYFNRLYHFLLVLSRGKEDEAQEALQQTLLRVARYARPFDSEESFWCWLKVVARSATRDAGRKQQRYSGLLKRFTIWARREPDPPPDPDNRLRAELDECLSELAPEDRLLLEQKYLDGATVRELAWQTGLTEKAIDSRLVRLRRRLREQLLKRLG